MNYAQSLFVGLFAVQVNHSIELLAYFEDILHLVCTHLLR